MTKPHVFQLFDYVVQNATGDALRLVHKDETGHQPVWKGVDRRGAMCDVSEEQLVTDWRKGHPAQLEASDPARVLGCLLAGAAGDALGAAVEFSGWDSIRDRFGPRGIRRYAEAYGRLGAITDDTQMTLFTAEGLIRASVRSDARGICHPPSVIHHSLLRWLVTQGREPATETGRDGWLLQEQRLWSKRAPGRTCMSALAASRHFGAPAQNNSKGCGGVMRAAPCAFFSEPFETASESCRYTHGHPTGYMAAGLFADILHRLCKGKPCLVEACVASLEEYGGRRGMEETRQIVEYVLRQHRYGVRPTPERIEMLGGGWVAEEALAIGLWCALSAESLEDGIVMAVNHSGDSDSTGSIAGNFLGLMHGPDAIPAAWLQNLELRDVITHIAADICYVPGVFWLDDPTEASRTVWERYPGW